MGVDTAEGGLPRPPGDGTPGPSAISSPYGTFWQRAGAMAIDGVFVGLFSLAAERFGPQNVWLYDLLCPMALVWAYDVGMLAAWGQTFGKMFTGVRVVSTDISRIGLRQAFLRNAVGIAVSCANIPNDVRLVSLFPDEMVRAIPLKYLARLAFTLDSANDHHVRSRLLLFGGLGLAWGLAELVTMLFHPKRRAIHDLIAGTVVVRTAPVLETIGGRPGLRTTLGILVLCVDLAIRMTNVRREKPYRSYFPDGTLQGEIVPWAKDGGGKFAVYWGNGRLRHLVTTDSHRRTRWQTFDESGAPVPPPDLAPPWKAEDADVTSILGDAPRYHVPVGDRPCRGASAPLVTMVEFIDFQSPFVRRAEESVDRLLLEHAADLRVCVRHFPIARDNPDTVLAAEAAEEALAQGGATAFFLAYKHLLNEPVTPASIEGTISAANLDPARFHAALADHRHRSHIEGDLALAASIGHLGAPTFFVQGRFLQGAVPYSDFEQLFEEELGRAKQLVDAGIPRNQVLERVLACSPPTTATKDESLTSHEDTVWIKIISVSFGGYGLSPATRTREEARTTIDGALARIRAGEDFSEVARQSSEDSLAPRGGDQGAVARGHLITDIDYAAFALPVGGVSAVVEGQHGFAIVQRYR